MAVASDRGLVASAAALERLVRNELRRLHNLKEASQMRNEWDMLARREDGAPQSIFPRIAGSNSDPHEEAARHEEEAEGVRLELGIEIYLNGDEEAKGVFKCLCEGVVKRREIAARLGMSVAAVTTARKRLERKVKEYRFQKVLIRTGGNGVGPRLEGNGCVNHTNSGRGRKFPLMS